MIIIYFISFSIYEIFMIAEFSRFFSFILEQVENFFSLSFFVVELYDSKQALSITSGLTLGTESEVEEEDSFCLSHS